MLYSRRAREDLRTKFLETARSHLGYRSRPGGLSDFGQTVGYSGHDIPWDGAFVDVVARTAGVNMPACVNTTSGLAEFIYSRRWRERPRPGDVVFFSFTTVGPWDQPHVGIVTDVTAFETHGYFKSIEAQVDSGLPRGSKDRDGVYERVRWRYEVLGFCRPNFKPRPAQETKNTLTAPPLIKIRNVRPGKRHPDVETVQLALVRTSGLKVYDPGLFDGPTQQALARWQRRIGISGPDATGIPTPASLNRLGRESGIFLIAPDE